MYTEWIETIPLDVEKNDYREEMSVIEYYLNTIETDGINAFCKNVKRKGYIYADYIGETLS